VRLRTTITTLLVLAGAALASCGGDEEEGKPIPADAATQLESRLVEIQNRFNFGGGACADITDDSEPAVNEIIASLPDDTDADLRDALRQGFDRLFELNADQCDEEDGQETTPDAPEEPADTTETLPPPTETDTTETTPPETTPEEPPDPTIPPDEGGGDEGEGEVGSGGVIGPGSDG